MKARALSVINELIRPVGFIRLVDFSSVHDLFIWSWRILIMLINFQAAKTNCAAITWFLFVKNSLLSVFLQFPIVCLFNSFKKRISSQSDHRCSSQGNAFANLAWSVAPCMDQTRYKLLNDVFCVLNMSSLQRMSSVLCSYF